MASLQHAVDKSRPKEIRDPVGKPIDSDKKHCLELKTLDVLHIEDAHLTLIADHFALLASGEGKFADGQRLDEARSHPWE